MSSAEAFGDERCSIFTSTRLGAPARLGQDSTALLLTADREHTSTPLTLTHLFVSRENRKMFARTGLVCVVMPYRCRHKNLLVFSSRRCLKIRRSTRPGGSGKSRPNFCALSSSETACRTRPWGRTSWRYLWTSTSTSSTNQPPLRATTSGRCASCCPCCPRSCSCGGFWVCRVLILSGAAVVAVVAVVSLLVCWIEFVALRKAPRRVQ